MKKTFQLLILILVTISFGAFATEAVAYTDPTSFIEGIIALFGLVKAGQVGAVGIASAVLALILQAFKLQILKRFLEKNRILTTALTATFGIAITVLTAMGAGMSWSNALIAGLVTQGGAMALYNVWRSVFKKD